MTLRLEAAGYTYAGADRQALSAIELELKPGDVVGVAGASEAGKSTLCLVCCGLAPSAIGGRLSGRVTIDGLDTSIAPTHELAQRCGVLFQQPATQISATTSNVWEEVALGPRNLSLPLDEVVERTWHALAAVGIADLVKRDPNQLSGGQLQLVALAGVLAMRPAYLVLDEPTSQLDPAGTALVASAIAGLAAGGTSILVAEQKTDLLARLCQRVLILDGGRPVLDGPPAQVLSDERLADWGVEQVAPARLQRALGAAGLTVELPL